MFFGELTGLVAVVLIFGGGIIRSALQSHERLAQMRVEAQKTPDQDVLRRLDALDQEIARLRDTSTQFDLSHDNALERISQRVSNLEDNRLSAPAELPRTQTVERR
jgi:hypothetical protein